MSYSFSQIKAIYECGFKYKCYYIDKISEPSGINALFGQAIHKIFKNIISDSLERKQTLALWKGCFENEVSSNRELIVIKNYEFWLKRGYPVIQKFISSKDKFDIQTIIKIEERNSSVYNGDEFSYVCDMVYKNSLNEIVVLDYKTGKQKETDFYQLVFYALLMGIPINKFCLYYVWDGPVWFSNVKYLDSTKKYIDEGVKIIKKGEFKKNPTKNCKYCYFMKKQICDTIAKEEVTKG